MIPISVVLFECGTKRRHTPAPLGEDQSRRHREPTDRQSQSKSGRETTYSQPGLIEPPKAPAMRFKARRAGRKWKDGVTAKPMVSSSRGTSEGPHTSPGDSHAIARQCSRGSSAKAFPPHQMPRENKLTEDPKATWRATPGALKLLSGDRIPASHCSELEEGHRTSEPAIVQGPLLQFPSFK